MRRINKQSKLIIFIVLTTVIISSIFMTSFVALSVLQPETVVTYNESIRIQLIYLNKTDISNTTTVTIYKVNSSLNKMDICNWIKEGNFIASEVDIDPEENMTYIVYVNVSTENGNIIQYEFLQSGLNLIRLIPTTQQDEFYTYLKVAFMNNMTHPIPNFDYIIKINESVYNQKGFGYRGYPFNSSKENYTDMFDYLDLIQINVTFNLIENETLEDLIYSKNLTIYSNLMKYIQILDNDTLRINIMSDLIDKCEINFRYSNDYIQNKSITEMSIPVKFEVYYAHELIREDNVI